MPCPGPFHVSYSVDYVYGLCPLPEPDVGLSIFVCGVEHKGLLLSILVCAHRIIIIQIKRNIRRLIFFSNKLTK